MNVFRTGAGFFDDGELAQLLVGQGRVVVSCRTHVIENAFEHRGIGLGQTAFGDDVVADLSQLFLNAFDHGGAEATPVRAFCQILIFGVTGVL